MLAYTHGKLSLMVLENVYLSFVVEQINSILHTFIRDTLQTCGGFFTMQIILSLFNTCAGF
jgi:hypothetical protein